MSEKSPKWENWMLLLLGLAFVGVCVTSINQTYQLDEAKSEVRRLKAQLQKTESQLNRMDTESFHNGEVTFFLVRKTRINNQHARLLGIKFINPMNGAETALVPGNEATNYYIFKSLKPIPWAAFQVKIVTTKGEEFLTLLP